MRAKLTLLILTISLMHLSASTTAQQITMSLKNVSLTKALSEIKSQSGYDFVIYTGTPLKNAKPVTISVKDAVLDKVLQQIFLEQPMSYQIESKTIVIREISQKGVSNTNTLAQTLDVKGRVVTKNKEPLQGVSVMVKGNSIAVSTDKNGEFLLKNVSKSAEIIISHLGYVTKVIEPKADLGSIVMETFRAELGEVVVNTGMFKRDKQTFTGAEATFSGEELRQVGNLNILQSLKTLDPAFIITPDNTLGSNPNQLPQIEVRGKTSISTNDVQDQFTNDPNQPLFILNGMETSLQQIIDLDMNRIASVTLLKDAASTALYGSRAANGVLVVETVKATPGKVQISYAGTTRLEAPDLRGYNMMNAAENLEFQRLAGLYTNNTSLSYYTDNLYNQRLTSVLSGVDSYWLNVPLRNSITQSNSLNASGGSEEFQYNIGLNYRKLNGVMKGSDRTTPGATIDLNYRTGKVNISNQFYINGYTANESPYGTFSDYVNLNPYYNKYDSDGNLNNSRYLESYLMPRFGGSVDTIRVTNPLYNASLNTVNKTNNTTFQNNLQAIWDITDNLRLNTALQLQKGMTDLTLFLPASHTQFEELDYTRKGLYSKTTRNDFSYQTNMMLTYRKFFNNTHSITGNLRGELQEIKNNSLRMAAEGFPDGVNPNPTFAYSYEQNSKPTYSSSKVRRVNLLMSLNYAYKNRYYADLTYRVDGSTSFGSEEQFSPFWSTGLGWTISNEKWFKQNSFLTQLRLRATTGVAGNQSLGSYSSSNVYIYENDLNPFGQGVYLSQLGNPNLEWQRTTTNNIGLDAILLGGKGNLTVNMYSKVSSPLIATGNNPTSSGVSTYVLNAGELKTNGLEFSARYSPIYKTDRRVVWTLGLTGSVFKSEYANFSNVFKNLNEAALTNNQLQRYMDGYSPDEQWAVTSMGIDPATGKEVFLRKDGTYSFVYDVNDIVPQGQNRPKIQGVISTNLRYKGFYVGINLRYSLGANIFNTALYSKVENITEATLPNNQDKRALELRWQNPGDIAQFKAINITSSTPMSSRFIQQENFLSGESINLSYDFTSTQYTWMKRAGVKTLRLSAITNDVFRLSNIQAERGISYPFSRAVSFNINLFF